VPATTNFVLTLQFNRSMRSTPDAHRHQQRRRRRPASRPSGGRWTTTAVSNDTYTTPDYVLDRMDGTNRVFVSGAQDLSGGALALTMC